uniref:Uncharacterized protein n=1 Tax=Rhizophagus irregularis (strain DAOM 181602 / DAOM 197198 / MUCL 43194) TaxID=747089 RepID=U9TL27_RHIID
MGLNILKFFSVLSIFLFVASAYHLAERAVVTCDHCAPVSGIGDCSSNSFTSISQWDCSGSTNAICTSLCTGCTLTCTSATSIAWTLRWVKASMNWITETNGKRKKLISKTNDENN